MATHHDQIKSYVRQLIVGTTGEGRVDDSFNGFTKAKGEDSPVDIMRQALALDGISAEAALAVLNSPFLPEALASSKVQLADSKLEPVRVKYDIFHQTWQLLEDYRCTTRDRSVLARAPHSFDLTSVPRILWSVIAPNQLCLVAPLFHDLIYHLEGTVCEPHGTVTPKRTYSRKECDDLFLEMMELEGVPNWRRWAAYFAVRRFGQGSWGS